MTSSSTTEAGASPERDNSLGAPAPLRPESPASPTTAKAPPADSFRQSAPLSEADRRRAYNQALVQIEMERRLREKRGV